MSYGLKTSQLRSMCKTASPSLMDVTWRNQRNGWDNDDGQYIDIFLHVVCIYHAYRV